MSSAGRHGIGRSSSPGAPPAQLESLAWPLERAAEAMECLARAARLGSSAPVADAPVPTAQIASDAALRSEWLEQLGAWLGIEAIAVEEPYPGLGRLVRAAGPALIAARLGAQTRLFAVLGGRRARVRVLDPRGHIRSIPALWLERALAAPVEAQLAPELGALLDAAGVPAQRRPRALAALLRERLAQLRIGSCWLLRPAAHASVALEARVSRAASSLGWLLLAHAAQYAFFLFSWEAATNGALLGRVDRAWLAAWLLALLSAIPFDAATAWLAARFALDAGAWLRGRLLAGILRGDPQVARREGTGQLLSRVLESGTLETLGLGGGLQAALAVVDLAVAGLLLARGAASGALLAALGGSLAAALLVAHRYLERRREWTALRLQLTHDGIERMVGQRTRLAQEPAARWHDVEDALLARYLESSARFDRIAAVLPALPRLWMVVSFGALMTLLWSARPPQAELALALAGILVASQSLALLAGGLAQLCGAAVAWQSIAPLFRAAAQAERAAHPTAACGARGRAPAWLEARDLAVRHPGREELLLSGVDLAIRPGDRVLLEGASGSGKSTLARVLAGFQPAQRGLLLSGGLDRPTLGAAGWSRRVTVAPQFHDNHVLGGSFAFNLLLGRRWPPEAGDLEQAESLCRDLGLGPLLERMPGGLLQSVGETGWQLSHGERSRLFAARAILADSDLVVLDESIAALDPETAEAVVRCARARTRSLMLIAHP